MPLVPSGLGEEFCPFSFVLNFASCLAEFQNTNHREAPDIILSGQSFTSILNSLVASCKLWVLSFYLKQLFMFSLVLLVAKLKQRNPSAACAFRDTNLFFFFSVGLKMV